MQTKIHMKMRLAMSFRNTTYCIFISTAAFIDPGERVKVRESTLVFNSDSSHNYQMSDNYYLWKLVHFVLRTTELPTYEAKIVDSILSFQLLGIVYSSKIEGVLRN